MKLTKNRIFRARVNVTIPDGDQTETQTFTAAFRALTRSELEQHRVGTVDGENTFLRAVVAGWDGLTDDRDGKDEPFEFSAENLEVLLEDMFVRAALMNAWGAALGQARRGN